MSAVTTTQDAATTARATGAAAADFPRALSLRWIISARDDLVWFIGPALLSYAFFAAYVTRAVPVAPLLAAWLVLVDTPHVFSTYTRTYFDREERHSRKRLLAGSLALFLAGPSMVLAGAGTLFFVLAALWTYYHQLRQHYGFAVIYKIKNDDLAPADNLLDRLLFLFGFGYPFVVFALRSSPAWAARLPAPLVERMDVLTNALLAVTLLVAAAWLARQAQRALKGLPLNGPKLLLLTAIFPLYWTVLLVPAPYKLAAVILILSPFHTLQYHRLMWFHNRKYVGAEARERYGLAALVNRRLLFYVAAGLGFSLVYHLVRRQLALGSGGQETLAHLALAFLTGHLLVHFYLDSKIWRVRRDPAVGRTLALRPSDA